MCIKSIYYNTYGDGSQDVTERVDTCTPGEMCRRPETREYNRKFRFTKLVEPSGSESSSSLADRKPTPYTTLTDYHLRLPPTPRRSKSPSPSRKHKSSAVYVNDAKVADISSSKKRHSHVPSRSDRGRVILHAPEPPAPRLTRSATLPAEYLPAEAPPRHRSRDVPVGPVQILENLGRRRSSSSQREERDSHRPTSHYRRHVRGGDEFVLIDDEREQRERRRAARRSSTMYGRSSDFSSSSGAGATDSVYVAPAVAAANKKLRWEDQVQAEIAAQNERISARPKLHQEVKGILKNPKGKDVDVYDDLRRAVRDLDVSNGGKDRTSPRRSDNGEYEYDRDRLRARFGDEPRERKRRSRVSYGAGMYDYQ